MALTEAQQEQAREMYLNNISVREICSALDTPEGTVYAFFSSSNLPSLREVARKQVQDTIYKLYLSGQKLSYKEIAKLVGRSSSHVCRVIKKYEAGEETLSPDSGVVLPVVRKSKQARLKEKVRCCMCELLQSKTITLSYSSFYLCHECLMAVMRYPQKNWSAYLTEDMLREVLDDPISLRAVEYYKTLQPVL